MFFTLLYLLSVIVALTILNCATLKSFDLTLGDLCLNGFIALIPIAGIIAAVMIGIIEFGQNVIIWRKK